MVTICALATNSTAFVGFYFADPNNWLAAGFFKDGTIGMLKGASNYLCTFIGIETLSFLLEETKNPRKRLPLIMPFIITALTLIMFLTTMVITLVADITTYPNDMLFPDIFDKLGIPSAKYVMTVGSVCGLSGTMLAIFVPATRILASLCGDNLLPLNLLSHTSKKRGVPYHAVLLCALLSSSLIILNTVKLFAIIAFSTPLRLILLACLVYNQRYNPNIVGLLRETAFYRVIHHKRYRMHSYISTNDKDSTSSITLSKWSTDDESNEMISGHEILQNIIAQQEAQCNQWLEKLPSINENLGMLSNSEEVDKKLSERILAKRSFIGSQYNTFKNSQSLTENLKETTTKFCKDRKRPSLLSLDSSYHFGHNCIRSPCVNATTDINKHKFHIFEHDIPELAYWTNYPGSMDSSENFDKTDYKRSLRTLSLFFVISVTIGFLILKTESGLTKLYSILLVLLACLALGCLVMNSSQQKINPMNNERSCKTPVFPYLTLFTIFLATLIACTTDYITVIEFIAWIVVGIILYALYGYRHSKEARASLNSLIITNCMITDSSSTEIMNNTNNYQSTG
ncbi:Amino acid permease family protein [Acanthocheilonema viteae]